jgi:hypothetical protein
VATKGDRVRDSIADSESFKPASKGGRLQSEWVADFLSDYAFTIGQTAVSIAGIS